MQETSKVVFKAVKSHDSALYKVKCMNENLMSTGDEDGTVKIWDKRKSPDGKHSVVMESKQFDEHVNDIFFDETVDEKTMVASSGEGKTIYLLTGGRSFNAGPFLDDYPKQGGGKDLRYVP